jgi:type I restriction enzyme M protein
MNKQQLAAKIWESANQMRSKIEANEYKDYILGFIFYKYLSEKQLQFARKNDFTEENIKALSEDDTETVDFIKKSIGYFLSYDNLFHTWIEEGADFSEDNVITALSAFNRSISPKHKKLFDGIFNTLETGLSKLGDTAAKRTKAIRDLLYLIKDIPMDGKQDYDVLGFIYEYLIEKFAANAGKKAGEFYTPHEVSVLMSEIVSDHLKDRKEIQIYDSCSGSGSLLINIGSSIAKYMDDKDNIKYFAQELKKNTYNLTRMNLVMRGLKPDNIETRNGDTLEDDWPYFDENDPVHSYNTLYVDAVVSNPPYSQKWSSANKESDPRYSRFGLAPKTKADFAFLLHDLYHLKPDGIMNIVLPHGVLFRGGEEGNIRRHLIEENHIDTIIGLPAGVFFGTGIPTVIIVLKQKRTNTDVLIVDASKGFIKEGKNNKLRASDIRRIADVVRDRKDTPKFSKKVTRDTIRANDYNLNIPRYVDSSPAAENWDIYASMFGGIPVKEIDALQEYWDALPDLRTSLFEKTTDVNAQLKVNDIKESLQAHKSVQTFKTGFNTAFKSFEPYLNERLLSNPAQIGISKEQIILSNDIFIRLENIALIDEYEAYQLLDDKWQVINVDLEIIQTEGIEATRIVDANMVIKKKNGKDTEVQDGWKGRIMPFDLVQQLYLSEALAALQDKENKLVQIAASIESIFEDLDEDDKEEETVNEAKTGFTNAAVIREAKQLRAALKKDSKLVLEPYEKTIIKVDGLLAEEKKLKKEVKADALALHLETKDTIEALADHQITELLQHKWIKPVVKSLHSLPNNTIDTLSRKLQHLADKYATTYSEVAKDIKQAENALADLLDDLTGNEHDMKAMNEFKNLLKTEN